MNSKRYLRLFILIILLVFSINEEGRAAIKTASSFDMNYSITGLSINAGANYPRTLNSMSGYELDYNVALFDYRTVATLNFSQFTSSNVGPMPLTRIGLAGSYHFIRMNGQRILLDSDVEGKIWGISPALELGVGMTLFAVADPQVPSADFSVSTFDVQPRVLIEIPFSSSFLFMVRGGYWTSVGILSSGTNRTNFSGYVFSLGAKITTL